MVKKKKSILCVGLHVPLHPTSLKYYTLYSYTSIKQLNNYLIPVIHQKSMIFLVLLASLMFSASALTAEELAAFKPRIPDYVDFNTGKKADVYAVDNEDGSQTIHTNGVPSHNTWAFPSNISDNPNYIKEKITNLKIYSEPIMRSPDNPMRCQPLGYIGIATSGTLIFSWFPTSPGCIDVIDFEELDICEGHPSPFDEYHYHHYSPCVQMPVCGEPSPIFGVAIDGIPIYGPISEDGVQLTSEDLDECGGRTDRNGRYKYHITSDPYYFMSCFRGEFRSDCGKLDREFMCTCPYDDRMFKRRGSRPPPPGPTTVCSKSKNGSAPMTCTDKEYLANLQYDIGYEWKRQPTKINLLPCCPKGEDCGNSCTKKGKVVKDICEQETKTVQYMTRVKKQKESIWDIIEKW